MANKVYQPLETAITWLSSGGSAAFNITSLGSLAGHQGAHYDFGTASIGRRFAYRAWTVPGASRTVGEQVLVYLKTSDGTSPDNDDGTGDIALSASDKLSNLMPLRPIVIDENAAVRMVSSGIIEIFHRYAAPVFFNATSFTLTATATDNGFSLTPVPDEIQ
jgi:hypothetical protein